MNTPEIYYRIDENDQIIEVNESWNLFAKENAGKADIVAPNILGRKIWDFIADPTTRHLYQRLFDRVRDRKDEVRFSFRCDAPTERRQLQMEIQAEQSKFLLLKVRAERIEERPEVLILDCRVTRSDVLVRMCAWCKRMPDAQGEWVEVEEALTSLGLFNAPEPPVITHTVCDDCNEKLLEAIEDPDLAASGEVRLGALGGD